LWLTTHTAASRNCITELHKAPSIKRHAFVLTTVPSVTAKDGGRGLGDVDTGAAAEPARRRDVVRVEPRWHAPGVRGGRARGRVGRLHRPRGGEQPRYPKPRLNPTPNPVPPPSLSRAPPVPFSLVASSYRILSGDNGSQGVREKRLAAFPSPAASVAPGRLLPPLEGPPLSSARFSSPSPPPPPPPPPVQSRKPARVSQRPGDRKSGCRFPLDWHSVSSLFTLCCLLTR